MVYVVRSQRGLTLLNFFNSALHVEVAFGHVVVLALEDFFETTNGVGHRHLFAFTASKDLGHRKRLAERSEEHTSELQSRLHLVCRLLLEKKKKNKTNTIESCQQH